MDALRRIHALLAPGGTLVDTQPVDARPPVSAAGAVLGELDLSGWLETIRAVDRLLGTTVAAGLFEPRHEERYVVADEFDSGPEAFEKLVGWRGTRVPDALGDALRAAPGPVTVEQEIRLRLLTRRP